MRITYELRTDIVNDEERCSYIVYGIMAKNIRGKTLQSIPDIFFDREKAEEFVNLCNSEKLELVHLMDVIEEILV